MPADSSVEFHGFAVKSADSKFEPWSYHPRPLGDDDIEVAITHCGICGSDIHTAFGGWGKQEYPLIVGHEIVGTVKAVGKNVEDFKVGDRVGCGAQCGACADFGKTCRGCSTKQENHCTNNFIGTYSGKYPDGERSQGGYADAKRFHQRFAFHIPESISSAEAAPLLCAGVTTFAPLKRYDAGPGKKVAIIGIGGLGHLAVQFAAKMGADVTAFGTSPSKKDLALKLGAKQFVNIKDEAEFAKHKYTYDLIICTASATGQEWNKYVNLGALDAHFVILALPEEPVQLGAWGLCMARVNVTGSAIGSPVEIREMLEFCSQHGVRPMIEVLPMSQVNEGIRKVQENDVKFRIVLEQGK